MAFVTTDTKNPNVMLWSTSPTNRLKRGASLKKDIALAPMIRRKSKVFRGYTKTIEPPKRFFQAKSPISPKKGRYVAELRSTLENRSHMLQNNSTLQHS